MYILVLALVVICLMWFIYVNNQKYKKETSAAKSCVKLLIQANSAANDNWLKIVEAKDAIITIKDKIISEKDVQIANYVEMVDNMSELAEEEDDEEELEVDADIASYNKTDAKSTVLVSSNYAGSPITMLDQRSIKANVAIKLYEAREEVLREKDNIPPATYENLMKHLGQDS